MSRRTSLISLGGLVRFGGALGFCTIYAGRTQDAGGGAAGRLATLQGETVRFHIRLRKSADADPRLYAVYIRSQERQP